MILAADGVQKRFCGVHALRGAHLHVYEGEVDPPRGWVTHSRVYPPAPSGLPEIVAGPGRLTAPSLVSLIWSATLPSSSGMKSTMKRGSVAPAASPKRRMLMFQRAPAAWFAITRVSAPTARPSQKT